MAAEMRRIRKSNFSQEEIDVLVRTVTENHDLLYGSASKNFFYKEIRDQVWNIVLEEVNKISPERRTLNEIKNKWKKCQHYDLKRGLGSLDFYDLDSMPLQQRLSQNHNESAYSAAAQQHNTVLQSQPISPTKLKVTRQGKPQARSSTPSHTPTQSQVCLKWNSHHVNMQSAFPDLLTKEQYVDATLVSEGKTLKCHKMILSSCSPYFEEILSGIGPLQHPVLFMRDTPFWILKALCDFMYAGEVHIMQDKLQELLDVASALKIKGLATPSNPNEVLSPSFAEIKQEMEDLPPLKPFGGASKQDDEDILQSQPIIKLVKHDLGKASRKKEDKRSRLASQGSKEKTVDESAKVVLPKPSPLTKPNVKSITRNLEKSPSKVSHGTRRTDTAKRGDKRIDAVGLKEIKEKEKEKLPLKKDNINDPLDLLQPVYEEIAKEEPAHALKNLGTGKLREKGNVPVKKTVNRKMKKRRYTEYADEREESPPLVFSSRKGTRSRPHVKVPKYFHTHYEASKDASDATIVREPHTDQNDPLIGVGIDEIKAEPVDVEENAIVDEESLVNYIVQSQPHEFEEIIGNYDSPLVNIKTESKPSIFKKGLDPQPVIMNVHTVSEEAGLLDIKKENVEIVDIAAISSVMDNFDPIATKSSPQIIISNIQSMAEIPTENKIKNVNTAILEAPFSAELLPKRQEKTTDTEDQNLKAFMDVRPLEMCHEKPVEHYNVEPDPLSTQMQSQEDQSEANPELEPNNLMLNIRIENVRSEKSEESVDNLETQNENESKQNTNEENKIAVSSLGSLEAKIKSFDLSSEGKMSFETASISLPSSQEYISDEPSSEQLNTCSVLNDSVSLLKKSDENEPAHDKLSSSALQVPLENAPAPMKIENGNIAMEKNVEFLETSSNNLELTKTMSEIVENPELRDLAAEVSDELKSISEILPLQTNEKFDQHCPDELKMSYEDEINFKFEEQANFDLGQTEDRVNNSSHCIASTSNAAPLGKIRLNPKPLDIEEDFTKDISFDNFIDENKSNNYYTSDFSANLNTRSDFNQEINREEFDLPLLNEIVENQTLLCAATDIEMEEVLRGQSEETDNTEEAILENNDTIQQCSGIQNVLGETQSKISNQISIENEQQIEERLLADFDEDIIMSETTSDEKNSDVSEKTLEMIVNDLNESLGEINK